MAAVAVVMAQFYAAIIVVARQVVEVSSLGGSLGSSDGLDLMLEP